MAPITDISHTIQLAVAPVFLLTAVAGLINVTNTRLGRIVDRRRVLYERCAEGVEVVDNELELASLDRRSHLIYGAMLFEVLSGLLVCLVVASAFIGPMLGVGVAHTVALLFILAMAAMILSLGLFLREVYLALQSQGHRRP